jgi:hypothetical protein
MMAGRLNFGTKRMPEQKEQPMIWIDIAMTVLLTLRIALFRPALPQLLDPDQDAWLPEGKDEVQEGFFVVTKK